MNQKAFHALEIGPLLEACEHLAKEADLACEVEIIFALYLALPKARQENNAIYDQKLHAAFFRLLRRLQFSSEPVKALLSLSASSGELLIKIIAYLAPAEHLVALCTLYQIANERIVGNPYELILEQFTNRSPLFEMITSHADELLAFYCQRKQLLRDYPSQSILPSSWSPFVIAARCGNEEAFRLLMTMQLGDQYCELMREMPERQNARCPDIISVLRATNNIRILELSLQPFLVDMKNTLQYSIAAQILNELVLAGANNLVKLFLDAAKRVDYAETQNLLRAPNLCYNLYQYANLAVIREVMHIAGLEVFPLPQSSRIPFMNNRMYNALRQNKHQITLADIERLKNDLKAWVNMYDVLEKVTVKYPRGYDCITLKDAMVALYDWRLTLYHVGPENPTLTASNKLLWMERLKNFIKVTPEQNAIFVQAFQDICNHGEYFYPRFQEFIFHLESRSVGVGYLLAEELIERLKPVDQRQTFEVEKKRAEKNMVRK